ncbi:hypothetical protein IAQ61_001626 [Plenodomus lingam]|uniref:uncharacterized protein n=1 Tax=Leptosphaeria maculans TaxID=5022 RepID=UPI00332E6879|nr:hypothetical protein IAQ61_001626 [Plenodomus lingam]
MSEPVSPGPQARNKLSPSSSSTSSPEQKSTRPRAYSKYDANAGDCFAHARNLDHSLAPSAPAFAATSSSASGAQLPATFAFAKADTLARSFVPEARRDVPVPAAVKQGLEKGSYRRPSTNLAFPSGRQEARYTASSAFASRPSYCNHTQKPKVPPIPTTTTRAIMPREDVSIHLIDYAPTDTDPSIGKGAFDLPRAPTHRPL